MALTIDTRQFAGQAAARLLGRLAFQMNATMKSPDPEAVHDLRVAIRRFSQSLVVFKPCFPGKEKRKVRQRLKRLMVQAGEVRNCDVALKLLAKSRSQETAALLPRIRGRRKEAERVLTGALKRRIERKSSLKWRTILETALASAGGKFNQTPIEDNARSMLPRMAKEFLALGHAVAGTKVPPEKLHQFRIASKKFRYSLELCAPLYGVNLKRWIERMKRVQNLLGDINDCSTLLEMIPEQKEVRATRAWLKRRERRKIEDFRRWWQESYATPEVTRSWMRDLRNPPSAAIKKPAVRAETSHARAAAAGS